MATHHLVDEHQERKRNVNDSRLHALPQPFQEKREEAGRNGSLVHFDT
jgi:hypothetical protein